MTNPSSRDIKRTLPLATTRADLSANIHFKGGISCIQDRGKIITCPTKSQKQACQWACSWAYFPTWVFATKNSRVRVYSSTMSMLCKGSSYWPGSWNWPCNLTGIKLSDCLGFLQLHNPLSLSGSRFLYSNFLQCVSKFLATVLCEQNSILEWA